MKMDAKTQKMAAAALVGAAYAALTMALSFISYGPVQFRVSEVLCILPYFLPFTTWGLFAGCILANLISSAGVLDVIFGSLATLLACLCMSVMGRGGDRSRTVRCVGACLMPVLWNGVIVGAVLAWVSGTSIFLMPSLFLLYGGQVAFGEAVVMLALGLPCMKLLPKKKYFTDFLERFQ